jgi:CHAD domain-containing protein
MKDATARGRARLSAAPGQARHAGEGDAAEASTPVANEPLLRDARDPEAVHQMRVAMRRLRAAMSIFKRVFADERSDTVKNQLRALAGELGEARDIDVLLEKTIAPARERHPDEADLAALAESYEERREAAYDKAIEGLESGPFARTVLDAASWIETGPLAGAGGERRAARRAGRSLRGVGARAGREAHPQARQADARPRRLQL